MENHTTLVFLIALGTSLVTGITPGAASAAAQTTGTGTARSDETIPAAEATPAADATAGDDSIALCVCGDYAATARLDAAARIEIQGHVATTASITTHGALVLPSTALHQVASLSVGDDLAVQGPLRCQGDVAVDGNAWFGGATTISGTLHVARTTFLAPDATLAVHRGSAPTTQVQPAQVTSSCACDANAQSRIAALIATHRDTNDNGSMALDANTLRNVTYATRIVLPPGDYYFNGISAAEDITLVAAGTVNLFVNGDIAASNDLHIVHEAGGSLTMYVSGNVHVSERFFFGNVKEPTRAHLSIGGTALSVGTALNTAGTIYAPRANLALSRTSRLHGALWIHDLAHSGPLQIGP